MSLQGWYPLALSRDIAPGTSAGTHVHGKEYVVWRDDKAAPHVWEDRCPHRGMKMSFGFVRGDHIACLYHGWQYDTAGQCRYIPAHPDLDVPKTIRISRFAVTEKGGVIWGCFDGEEQETPPAPDMPANTTPLRTVFADCPASLLVGQIAATPFEGAAPQLEKKSNRIVAIHLDDAALTGCVQPLSESETALHLVATGDLDTAQLKRLSPWSEQLRRDAEAAAMGAKTAEIAA